MVDVFRETLQGLARRVEGVRGVSLIGRDGIAVDTFLQNGDVPLDLVAAEMTGFLKNLSAADLGLETGAVRQFAVVADNAIVVLSSVTAEYYLLMLLSPAGNFGRARYELRKAASTLEKELV
jgi:predicted regulator of Ras-like GTPase activity (Roadblock/LC7/MglB family)